MPSKINIALSLSKGFLGAYIAAGVLWSGCATKVQEGQFACDPEDPSSCPAGWVCQVRGSGGQHRCYSKAGGYCGNGVLDPETGEECDTEDFGGKSCEDFGLNSGYKICRPDCTVYCTICGNGLVEVVSDEDREECDDGNDINDDGCRNDCTLPRCGDEIIDQYETCDDGELNANLPDACRMNCQLPRCGDGIQDSNEVCDDGNLEPGDGCDPDCRGECGNGTIEPPELCDKTERGVTCSTYGFDTGFLGCSSLCMPVFNGCGNIGIKETPPPEQGRFEAIWGTSGDNIWAVGGVVGSMDTSTIIY